MMRAALVLALLASPAIAAPVTGVVEAARGRHAGDVIVTEATIRRDDGTYVDVIQLGGTAGGIGMWFSHHPAPLAVGDRVRVHLDGVSVLAMAAPPSAGEAEYGVVHTRSSKRPVWRETGCEIVAYGTSVTSEQASVFDAALATWTDAAPECGALALLPARGRVDAAVADGVASIHVRTDRWCRPATATEPELCYDPAATGVTRLRFVDDPFADDDGLILEADIELNGVDYALAVLPDATPSTKPQIDLPSLAAHEVGHLLGLSHSCAVDGEPWPLDHAGRAVPACAELAADAPAVRATMFFRLAPGEREQRTLEASDLAAACALASTTSCAPDITGATGCHASRDVSGLAGLGLAVVMARRRRRR